MLVLTRKAGEQVLIEGNDSSTVTVLAVRGSQVLLGFSAPKETKILRSELVHGEMESNHWLSKVRKEAWN